MFDTLSSCSQAIKDTGHAVSIAIICLVTIVSIAYYHLLNRLAKIEKYAKIAQLIIYVLPLVAFSFLKQNIDRNDIVDLWVAAGKVLAETICTTPISKQISRYLDNPL